MRRREQVVLSPANRARRYYPPIDVSGFKGTNLYIAAQANVVNITKGSMCVYSDNTLTFNGITSGKSGAAVVLTAVPPEWVSE